MNLIIDRLGDSVKPFASGLLGLFPQVWQDAEGQSLLRIQVCAKQTCVIRRANKTSIVIVNSCSQSSVAHHSRSAQEYVMVLNHTCARRDSWVPM